MATTNNESMTRSRGLITFTERERIAGKDGVEDSKRYQAISRVRRRINEELAEEVDLLIEHHPELLEELREVVCEDS
jgi:acyl-CoA hydrolase